MRGDDAMGNNSKYSDEMHNQTAEYVLESRKSATSVEDIGIESASSRAYQKMLRHYSIKGSMSCQPCPNDNACAESFLSSAKLVNSQSCTQQ